MLAVKTGNEKYKFIKHKNGKMEKYNKKNIKMEVKFGSIVIEPNELISHDLAQNILMLHTYNLSGLSTILIYDSDAPYPEEPTKSPLIHYLRMNIENNKLDTGDILMSYIPPNPPTDSHPHKYTINIYKQNKYIQPFVIPHRQNFDVKSFQQHFKLSLVNSFTFKVYPDNYFIPN